MALAGAQKGERDAKAKLRSVQNELNSKSDEHNQLQSDSAADAESAKKARDTLSEKLKEAQQALNTATTAVNEAVAEKERLLDEAHKKALTKAKDDQKRDLDEAHKQALSTAVTNAKNAQKRTLDEAHEQAL